MRSFWQLTLCTLTAFLNWAQHHRARGRAELAGPTGDWDRLTGRHLRCLRRRPCPRSHSRPRSAGGGVALEGRPRHRAP